MSNNELTGLEALRAAGVVARYHQYGPHLAQSVAAHSWGVATLALHLWPDCSRELLIACIMHDVGEYATGDIPAPTKWQMTKSMVQDIELMEEQAVTRAWPYMPVLSLTDVQRLKWCDSLELMIHCLEAMLSGDKLYAPGPFWRVADRMSMSKMLDSGVERLLLQFVGTARRCGGWLQSPLGLTGEVPDPK
jgi:5'-deoxynucleotidase YfbR-like HD superfamily hydrolase